MPVQKRIRQRAQYYRDTSPEQIVRDHRYGILLIPVILIGLWIRLIPRKNMDYLQALDPYFVGRSAEAIARTGHLPPIDPGRYVPFSYPTYIENMGNLYVPGYLYRVIEPVYNTIGTALGADPLTFATYAQTVPAFFGVSMVVIMYFIGKEVYNQEAGLFAAFFLAASPAVLHRSSAGWLDKEALATPFMFASIYCLIRAWKGKSWGWGILSGVSLAVAASSWGGTRLLFLLYPAAAFAVLFINEDIEQLLAAFTPTFLLGFVLAVFFNPERNMLPNTFFFAAMGVLVLIWIRYAVEAADIVDSERLPYVTPAATVAGVIALFLSPLYSQRLASRASSLASMATPGSGVIGGTVAENQAASAGQIISQFGVGGARNVNALQSLFPYAELFSGWTFAIVGTSVMLAMMGYMVLKKYDLLEEVGHGKAYFGFVAVLLAFSAFLLSRFPGQAGQAFIFPLAVGLGGALFLFFFAERTTMDIEPRWYLVIPLLWSIAGLYGATQRSRLLFLTAHPVALLAGFGLAVALRQLRQSTLWTEIANRSEELDARRVFGVAIALVLIPVLVFNTAAAQSMAEGIGGSPNQLWMDALEDVREETEPNAVLLSWWDYGYWFQSVAGRASNADGGNLKYYSDGLGHNAVNLPLADFLTADDYTEHSDFLEVLSADYMVLDASMVGKYSAVSQISYRDNSRVDTMQTAECVRDGDRCVMRQGNGKTYMVYGPIRLGRNARGEVLVPVQQDGNDLQPDGTPLIRLQGARGQGQVIEVENFCTTDRGIVSMAENATGRQGQFPGCIAWHPPVYMNGQLASSPYGRIVFVPENVMGSTLARLYLMDGYGMPGFEKRDDLSNGYVKIWDINRDAIARQTGE